MTTAVFQRGGGDEARSGAEKIDSSPDSEWAVAGPAVSPDAFATQAARSGL